MLKSVKHFVSSKKVTTFAVSKDKNNITQQFKTLWCIGQPLIKIMTKYVGNAFSLQMVTVFPATVKVDECSKDEALSPDNLSVVGHPDTAAVLGVKFNRVSVKLAKGDVLYVAQIVGGRLPEGCTTLPDGFTFKFLKVTIE